MSYTELSDLKEYLGITDGDDDNLLNSFIDRAQEIIDAYTGRIFEAETDTKYFYNDPNQKTSHSFEGRWLHLWGYDLLTVTQLLDGDADSTEFSSDQYRLEPRNETPKYAIRLNEDYSWDFDDSDSEVTVTGTWGYTTAAPADVEHACIRLAAYLYRQKDTSADIDRAMVTGDGVTIMPSSLPKDVRLILDKYRRRF